MNSEQDAAKVFGYEVTDTAGNKIGKVDNVWVDDATSELEFVGVKTGWFMGKTHVIPVANAQIDNSVIQVPFDQEQIKGAPSFAGDAELSPEQEDEIYGYYGEGRSTTDSPSGLPARDGADFGSGTTTAGYVGSANAGTDREIDTSTYNRDKVDGDQSVTLHEEELEVGKREVEAGRVRLRKVVHTEHQEVPVELRREEVEIERVPATGRADGNSAFQEEEIDVPVMREEAVVGKESRATEEVRLNKTVTTETENVGGDVRREDVVTDDSGTRFSGDTDTTTGTRSNRDRNY